MGNRRRRGSAQFTVAGLAMMSRQLPARPQSALSVSQLATSSSVCCERCICDRCVVLCDGACALSLLSVTVVRPSLVDQLITRTSMWCPWQVVDVCCISGLVLFALPHEGWSPNSLARMRYLFQVSTWTERASSLCARVALVFVSFDIVVVVANVAAREADADVKISWLYHRSVHAQPQDPQKQGGSRNRDSFCVAAVWRRALHWRRTLCQNQGKLRHEGH